MSGLRCFVGIGLGPEVREWLHGVRVQFVSEAPGWGGEKWVRDENLHVTVRFLGDVGSEYLDDLSGAIGREVESVGPYELSVVRFEARPSARRARMLWAALLDSGDGFARTVEAVDSACEGFDIEVDRKPQRPHVTLCRARKQRSVPTHALMQLNDVVSESAPIVSVPSVSLFVSRLTPNGPRYEALGTWRFGAL